MLDSPIDALTAVQTDVDQSSILALGVDVSHVRGCLLENVSGTYRLAAWQSTPRREKAGLDDLAGELLRQMGQRLHRTLWHSRERMPITTSEDPVRQPPLGQVVVTASPRPHVRVWLAGLTPTQSMAAALDAMVGSPAQVIGQTAYMADLQVGPLTDSLGARRARPGRDRRRLRQPRRTEPTAAPRSVPPFWPGAGPPGACTTPWCRLCRQPMGRCACHRSPASRRRWPHGSCGKCPALAQSD